MVYLYLINVLVLILFQISPPSCLSFPNNDKPSPRAISANTEYQNPLQRQRLSRESVRQADFAKTKRNSKCHSKGLFSSKDVVVLETDTLEKSIHGSKTFWYVLFYAHWCGHCVHFSKTWKAVGRDTKGWTKYVHIGAIDCARKRNSKICRKYKVKAYPTMRMFKPFSHKGDIGQSFEEYNFADIHDFILDRVINTKNFSDVFEPVTLKSLKTIEKSGGIACTYLVFQRVQCYLGEELILDFSNYKNLNIRTVSRDDKGMMKKFAVKTLPSMYLLHKTGTFSEITVANKTRKAFQEALLRIDKEKPHSESLPKSKYKSHCNKNKNAQGKGKSEKDRSMVVHMTDLFSTLTYMFEYEIPNTRLIVGSQLQALRNFIIIIGQYFPSKEVRGKFNNLFIQIAGKTAIFGTSLDIAVRALQLPRVSWVGCKGSEEMYRGYPCGCWQLFHTLLIRSFYTHQPGQFSPSEVLDTVIEYVNFFFGCRECRNNFIKLSMSVEKEVRSEKEAVMWLWKIHNKVNRRLHGDIMEDPKHPKIQFPNAPMCANCRDKNQNWMEDNVLKFLHYFYITNVKWSIFDMLFI